MAAAVYEVQNEAFIKQEIGIKYYNTNTDLNVSEFLLNSSFAFMFMNSQTLIFIFNKIRQNLGLYMQKRMYIRANKYR